MITDPLTLGITGHQNTFSITETGPGAKSIRPTTDSALAGASYSFEGMTLTISHEKNKSNTRRRSLVRLDFKSCINNALMSPSTVPPPFAYIVVDRPIDELNGDTVLAAKELLSRILGFLTANATAAPSHSFSGVPHVEEWLRGEP